jgi:Protein of unknown function (DUF2442)
MEHPIYRVTKFQIVGAYKLSVDFDDGVSQTINFEPVLFGEMYGPLRELAVFNKVKIDPDVHTLVWPNGSDFDPATVKTHCSKSSIVASTASTTVFTI